MKKFFFTPIIFLICNISFAQTGKAEFAFEKEVIKFEKVKSDTVLEFVYKFRNIGSEPLVISEIRVTCGCTKPEYPQHPIPPGKEETIKVSFDTKNKFGYQDRTLEIYSNAKKSPTTVRFKGVVDEKRK
jgi:hypothetical protein